MAKKERAAKVAEEYIAPKRTFVKDEVIKLLPQVPPKLIRALDYWALYSIHQEMVKSGMDAESAARRFVKGYDPAKVREEQERAAARKEREREARRKKAEAQKKKLQARAKAQAAKVKARAARAAARARAQASKAKGAGGGTEGGPPAQAYIPPEREHIKDDLVKRMGNIKRSDLGGLEWWQIYSMHTELVKFGHEAGHVAKKYIKGFKPVKAAPPPPAEPAPGATRAEAQAPPREEPPAGPVAVKGGKRKRAAKKKKAAPARKKARKKKTARPPKRKTKATRK